MSVDALSLYLSLSLSLSLSLPLPLPTEVPEDEDACAALGEEARHPWVFDKRNADAKKLMNLVNLPMVTSTAHKKLSIKPTVKKTDLLSSEHKQQLRDLGIMNAKDILNIRGLKALKALRHLQQAYLVVPGLVLFVFFLRAPDKEIEIQSKVKKASSGDKLIEDAAAAPASDEAENKCDADSKDSKDNSGSQVTNKAALKKLIHKTVNYPGYGDEEKHAFTGMQDSLEGDKSSRMMTALDETLSALKFAESFAKTGLIERATLEAMSATTDSAAAAHESGAAASAASAISSTAASASSSSAAASGSAAKSDAEVVAAAAPPLPDLAPKQLKQQQEAIFAVYSFCMGKFFECLWLRKARVHGRLSCIYSPMRTDLQNAMITASSQVFSKSGPEKDKKGGGDDDGIGALELAKLLCASFSDRPVTSVISDDDDDAGLGRIIKVMTLEKDTIVQPLSNFIDNKLNLPLLLHNAPRDVLTSLAQQALEQQPLTMTFADLLTFIKEQFSVHIPFQWFRFAVDVSDQWAQREKFVEKTEEAGKPSLDPWPPGQFTLTQVQEISGPMGYGLWDRGVTLF